MGKLHCPNKPKPRHCSSDEEGPAMIFFFPARMAQTLAPAGADKMNLDLCVGYLALIETRRSSRGMVVVVGV